MIQRMSVHHVLLLTIVAWFLGSTSSVSAAQGPLQAAFDAAVGGDNVGGVQLRLTPAVGAEQKAASDYLLRLAMQIRNGGQVPVTFDNNKISYQVEFEIDNVWYRMEGVPMNDTRALTVAPGGQGLVPLTFLINDTYRYHGLYAINSNGTDGRLNMKAGPHSIRVRTLPSAIQGPALLGVSLVSNTTTVNIPAIAVLPVASSQPSVRKPDITGFRFVTGPAGGPGIVNDFLKQPPTYISVLLAGNPKLLDFDSLRVLPPIAFFDYSLPEMPQTLQGGVPQGPPQPPSLPVKSNLYTYLVEADGKGVASIMLSDYPSGHTELWSPNPDTYESVRALSQLAEMEKVRTGSYEPRLLRVSGRAGSVPAMMLWLRSETGTSDLFYVLPNTTPRYSSALQLGTLYSKDEFLKVAGTHPAPAKDAAWAIRTVLVCAANAKAVGGSPLLFDKATAVPMEEQTGALGWRVTIPEQSGRTMPSGAEFLVDESTGKCTATGRE